jgi:preprotein translocase subunit YajC
MEVRGVRPENLILIVLILVFFLFMTRRTRRAQQEALATQERAVPGTRVVTTAGLYATVVGVEDGQVVLETAPGQASRWDRRAIARILEDDPAAEGEPDDPPAKSLDGRPDAE